MPELPKDSHVYNDRKVCIICGGKRGTTLRICPKRSTKTPYYQAVKEADVQG